MSILEYVVLACLAGALFFLFLTLVLFLKYLKLRKKIKKFPKKRLTNKKKRKKRQKIKRELLKQKQKTLKLLVVSLLLGSSFLAGAYGTNRYLSLSLREDDEKAIVSGYYVLRDFKKELKTIESGEVSEEQLRVNLFALATKMASFGTNKASPLNTEEGQLILNRYYRGISQIGINTSAEIKSFYTDETLVKRYLEDIKRVEKLEKQVFIYYKVEEDNLLKMK